MFPGNAMPISSSRVELQEGGVDLGRKFPPRAQSHRVVLYTAMNARRYRNQRETSMQHHWLHNDADVTMTERSDSPQIEWLAGPSPLQSHKIRF